MLLAGFLSVEIGFTCSPLPPTHHPIYLSYDELRNAVRSLPPRALVEPGKILIKDNFFYISEKKAGVHVIDNSDPQNPNNVAFINIPGNIDLAIRGETLYADSYVDLVAIDISDHESVQETGRLMDVYPYAALFDTGFYFWDEELDPDQGVVIGAQVVSTGGSGGGCGDDIGRGHRCSSSGSRDAGAQAPVSPSTAEDGGRAGSLARMLVNGDNFYLLAGSVLKSISVATLGDPVLIGTTAVGQDVETLYIHGNYLLIGAQTGVRMYDLSNPDHPAFLSSFSHAWQCDPIVAEGDTAYVTLRGGAGCNGFANQLDILDIADISAPNLIKSYALENPYGLGVDNNILFIADGYAGLKVFDVTDPLSMMKIKQFPDTDARDVILYQNRALITGFDGIFQYDYSQLDNIFLISSIPVVMQ